MDRKRKMRDDDEGAPSGNIMSLMKRLHLDRTSELYEKNPPLSERKGLLGSKRWRLSPIQEHGSEGSGSRMCVKRRRIDSEMAEQMTNALWITEAAEKEMALNLDDMSKDDVTSCHDPVDDVTSDDHVDDIPSLDNVKHVQMNVFAPQSLEDHFIQRQMKEQNMQLVLWTPPPVDIYALVEGSCDMKDISCHENESDESELMC